MDSLSTHYEQLLAWVPSNRALLAADIFMLLVALVVTVKLYSKRSRNPMGYPFPPGPKQSIIPLVGNIPDMPEKDGERFITAYCLFSFTHTYIEWFQFTEWGKQYGEKNGCKMVSFSHVHSRSAGYVEHYGSEDVHHQ